MGNCLVTKLKENVQNNNLDKIGQIVINVNTLDEEAVLKVYGSNGYYPEMHIEGNGYFIVNNTNIGKDVQPMTYENGSISLSAGTEYSISIEDKYSISSITLDNLFTVKNSQLGYLTSLQSLTTSIYTNIVGGNDFIETMGSDLISLTLSQNINADTSVINRYTHLSTLQLLGDTKTGNLTDLLSLTSLQTCVLQSTNITGDLSVLIDNGALVLPYLTYIRVASAYITCSPETEQALTALGVTVVLS